MENPWSPPPNTHTHIYITHNTYAEQNPSAFHMPQDTLHIPFLPNARAPPRIRTIGQSTSGSYGDVDPPTHDITKPHGTTAAKANGVRTSTPYAQASQSAHRSATGIKIATRSPAFFSLSMRTEYPRTSGFPHVPSRMTPLTHVRRTSKSQGIGFFPRLFEKMYVRKWDWAYRVQINVLYELWWRGALSIQPHVRLRTQDQ
ncbi:hypothetical protein CC78DRAFT_615761 [Lojkania enalia]|uniref:Uncharacterized protein n=1 Tax=Lojkania enalia TaxID=147567 RepID=A0A9P4KCC5_9PLEO|nr:hypothetical protein CC78DRAFT_615761 [Didymosphaeria enalia]